MRAALPLMETTIHVSAALIAWRLPAMYATLQLMETIIHVSAALTYGDYRPCESSFDCGQRRVRPAPLMETTVHVNRTLADGDYH